MFKISRLFLLGNFIRESVFVEIFILMIGNNEIRRVFYFFLEGVGGGGVEEGSRVF